MHIRRIIVPLALVAVVVAGCGEEDAAKTLAIVGDGSSYSGVPAELSAGVYSITFQNVADVADGPLFLETGGRTADEFMAEFAVALEGGPIPEYLDTVVGFPSTAPLATTQTIMTLPAGDYLMLSFFGDDREPVVAEVTVTGNDPDVDDLPADEVIAAKDYGFDVSGLAAGAQTVTFRNNGPQQFHHAVLQRFPDGTTLQQAEDAIDVMLTLGENDAPPDGTLLPEDVIDTGVFAPGTGGTFDVNLDAGGTYALFCFISDRQGGPPHAIAHGMHDVFVVEG